MDYAFYFLTLGFGGMLLLYAIALRLTLDVKMIPKSYGVKIKNPREYARTVAVMLALLSLAFFSGGWVALYAGTAVGALVWIACLAAVIWLCVRLWKRDGNKL